MPLQKILPKPGVNRENTRYTTEGGWYDGDKVRFRQGTPEQIGGWAQLSTSRFYGICRSIWAWVTLGAQSLLGLGTNLKFYLERGGSYVDITPIRSTVTLTDPFTATDGSNVIAVVDVAHGCDDGDFVTYSGAGITSLGGNISANVLTGEFQITYIDVDNYTITVSATASVSDTGHGGTVVTQYQINSGPAITQPASGWGAGFWGYGTWGNGQTQFDQLRLWSQANYGEDLIFNPRGGGVYYWNASLGLTPTTFSVTIANPAVLTTTTTLTEGDPLMFTTTGALPTGLSVGTVYYAQNVVGGTTCNLATTYGGANVITSGSQSGTHKIAIRGMPLSSLVGASDAPVVANLVTVSDASRFTLVFGTNNIGDTYLDPMVIRWSDQEDPADWTPTATNQAGDLRLSHGSAIIGTLQVRQEILVWTDSSLYSLQYLGPPYVWGSQLMGDNLSIISQNAMALASGIAFWMGKDKFYMYDGSVKTLRCDLREYIFRDLNSQQYDQVFAGTNEGFNEVWWFYCSENSTVVDQYVIYNYLEDIWSFGTMGRTAWLDSGIRNYPLAATYSSNIVTHEDGVVDDETGTPAAINSFIQSSEFDIGDGHNFAFVWRLLPDLTFRGSTSANPQVTMTLQALQNSGSGYNDPASVGGDNSAPVIGTATVPIEEFTGQVNIRVRGRQMSMRIENTDLGTTWQSGASRIDIRQDGRR